MKTYLKLMTRWCILRQMKWTLRRLKKIPLTYLSRWRLRKKLTLRVFRNRLETCTGHCQRCILSSARTSYGSCSARAILTKSIFLKRWTIPSIRWRKIWMLINHWWRLSESNLRKLLFQSSMLKFRQTIQNFQKKLLHWKSNWKPWLSFPRSRRKRRWASNCWGLIAGINFAYFYQPAPPPAEVAQAAVEVAQDESSQSSESDEYEAFLDRDFANSLLSNFGGPFQIEGKFNLIFSSVIWWN